MANGRRSRPKACKQCGKLRAHGYVISTRGLCRDCAIENMTEPGLQISARSGPNYDRWRETMIALMPSKADRF